jgi:hypothetical protein
MNPTPDWFSCGEVSLSGASAPAEVHFQPLIASAMYCGLLNRPSTQQLLSYNSGRPRENVPIILILFDITFFWSYIVNHVRIHKAARFLKLLVLDSVELLFDVLGLFSNLLAGLSDN